MFRICFSTSPASLTRSCSFASLAAKADVAISSTTDRKHAVILFMKFLQKNIRIEASLGASSQIISMTWRLSREPPKHALYIGHERPLAKRNERVERRRVDRFCFPYNPATK